MIRPIWRWTKISTFAGHVYFNRRRAIQHRTSVVACLVQSNTSSFPRKVRVNLIEIA
ncbi:MAG: hypothetical protein ABI210_04895 [Abditibacteriaceae bacterium]